MNTPTPSKNETAVRLYDEAQVFEGSRPSGLLIQGGDEILKLERELAAVTEQLDGLRSGIDYASDQLTRVTEQRDEARRLAEKYRNLSCDSQEEADETLLPWENNQPKPESKDPHRFCRGGGGNNFHCGCKYDG